MLMFIQDTASLEVTTLYTYVEQMSMELQQKLKLDKKGFHHRKFALSTSKFTDRSMSGSK